MIKMREIRRDSRRERERGEREEREREERERERREREIGERLERDRREGERLERALPRTSPSSSVGCVALLCRFCYQNAFQSIIIELFYAIIR